jgi:hypothetical protein
VGGCRDYIAKKESDVLQGYCIGMVEGLIYNLSICLPGGVTRVKTIRVVVQYIDSLPARLHEDFRSLAVEALLKTWPCRR